MKNPLVWVLLSLLSMLSVVIYSIRRSSQAKCAAANAFVASSAGVILHGGADNSWIENTNNYSVIIKHMYQFHNSDKIWNMFILNPGGKKNIQVRNRDSFIITQIMREKNLEVGFISVNLPKK